MLLMLGKRQKEYIMQYDLSVVIPARHEMFLSKTVDNLLKNKRGKTQIIVGLDGEWSNPPIVDHADLVIFYSPVPLGQRGMTNQCVRLSNAKYIMKLDSHCMVDEGFDVKLMVDMQDDWTVVPTMYNLHAFDWVCIGDLPKSGELYIDHNLSLDAIKARGCGHTIYQGPTPEKCPKCGGNMERQLIWKPRFNRKSNYYRFDKTLHFQYWGEYGNRPEAQGDVVPIFSAQGSCFMLTREKYWELEISDEKLAGKTGWGQQGVEVACKTWLSGGKLMVNKKTWYSHMFRTQGGDFGFPFPISGNEVDATRKKSREVFMGNTWPKAIHSFQWLLDKFYPIPDWHDTMVKPTSNLSRDIIFYTDNQLKLKYAHTVQNQLKEIGLPIISASLKPMPHFGKNIHVPMKRGLEAYFTQIITALETSMADIVYMCEADVLYHSSHFDFIPPTKDKFYYNQNFWRVRPTIDDLAVHWDANQVSGLVSYREPLLAWYKNKWQDIQTNGFDRSYEPGGRNKDIQEVFMSAYPNIDIRHEHNLTKSKWSINDFRDKSTCKNWKETTSDKIPGWERSLLAFV